MSHVLKKCIFLAVAVAIGSCSDIGSESTLSSLDFQVLSASVGANMMPIIPPLPGDRVGCSVDLVVRNLSGTDLKANLKILQGHLTSASTGNRFGTLYFRTDWDGALAPGASDTVRLFKTGSSEDFIQPSCGSNVMIHLEIGEGPDQIVGVSTSELTFGCVY